MVAASTLVLMLPSAWTQVMAITLAGLAGTLIYRPSPQENHDPLPIQVNPRLSIVWLILFAALLLGLPLMAGTMGNPVMAMVDQFYRAGSLVFGGGHVVLPLLQAETVNPAGVSKDAFLAGYGAAQAVPGPLFTFAAFLGASMSGGPAGWQGATIALLAIFLPSFLLVAGALPFWERIRQAPRAQAALMGINAAVVGLLLAALYDPVWSEGVRGPVDFSMVLVASIALVFWRVPPWLVVILCAAGGWLTGR
jgi:chromate transporter